MVVGVFIWDVQFKNSRRILSCDNESIVFMVNNTTSNCKHCMKLLRLLTLKMLQFNCCIFVCHVRSEANVLADSLSRLNFNRFKSDSSSSSTISTLAMYNLMEKLKKECFRDATKHNYYSVWKSFNKFLVCLDQKPNNWEDRILLFATYLVDSKRKSTTIKSYVTAIKATLKDAGIKVNEDRVLLNSITKACCQVNDRLFVRFPIHKGMLKLICEAVSNMFHSQPYLKHLYRAMFSTAYFGLFRVIKVTQGEHPILARDVHLAKK